MIHVHYPIMLLLANVMEKYHVRGIKIVVTEHWTKVLAKKLDAYELKQQKKYANLVDTYICVGNPLKNAILEMINSKREIQVVLNVANESFVLTDKKHNGFITNTKIGYIKSDNINGKFK